MNRRRAILRLIPFCVLVTLGIFLFWSSLAVLLTYAQGSGDDWQRADLYRAEINFDNLLISK